MIINFNYKKFFKYLFILVCFILLCNSCNVKANAINGKTANIITYNSEDFTSAFYKGNESNLISYYDVNYNYNIESSFITDIHNYILTQTGYSTWENFSNDYYYITAYFLNANSTGKGASAKFYARQKSDGVFDLAFSVDSDTRINPGSSYNSNIFLAPNLINTDFDYQFSFSFGNINNYSFTANNYGSSIIQTSCNSSNSNCTQQWDSSTNTMRIDIYKYLVNNGHPLFYDYNFAFNFVYNDFKYSTSYNSHYFYSNLSVNGINSYSFGDVVGFTNFFDIIQPNIQDLGDNSYGVNANTVSNIFLDYTNNVSSTVNCPNDVEFVNGVCNIYYNNIDNFDPTNTNVSDSAIWYLGNNNSILLDSSKFYVLTFRIYSIYNLDILTTIYHTNNNSTDMPFNILSKYYSDGPLYKDISIVFKPYHTGSDYLSLFNIVFTSLDSYTDTLSTSFNFGVYKTFKISEYDSQPTQSDVVNEQSDNSLNSIGNNSANSFFSDFRVNEYGLSPIVLYPLNFANSFVSYSCSSLSLPIPHLRNINLPCVSTFMSDNFFDIWNLYKVIFNGFIIYRILVNLFACVKNAYEPTNDKIEVVDL